MLSDLSAHIGAAEDAFAGMDTVVFKGAVKAMRDDIACLGSAPDPKLSAAVHEIEALDAYFDQDQGRALLSLRAMVEIWPEASLAADLAPEGGELRAWLAMAARVPRSPRAPRTPPPGHTLLVDGQAASDVPTDRPSLVLLTDPQGLVLWSGLFASAGALPDMGGPSQVEVIPKEERHIHKPILFAAGGLALVSAGLWAGGLYTAGQVDEVGAAIGKGRSKVGVEDGAAFEALAGRANALGIAGQITGALALGGCAVGLVVRW